METWLNEIIEQICIAKILAEGDLRSGNRLALILIDNAVELMAKDFARSKNLLTQSQLKSHDAFHQVIQRLTQNEIITTQEANFIRTYHEELRNPLYHIGKMTVHRERISEYIDIALTLLNKLFNFTVSDDQLKKLADDVRRNLKSTKAIVVQYEKKVIDGMEILTIKSSSKLKKGDATLLLIHGYITNYVREPNYEDLEKSLRLSGYSDVTRHKLRAIIQWLRNTRLVYSDKLQLTSLGRKKIARFRI